MRCILWLPIPVSNRVEWRRNAVAGAAFIPGVIPSQLRQVTTLKCLQLHNNQLVGPSPWYLLYSIALRQTAIVITFSFGSSSLLSQSYAQRMTRSDILNIWASASNFNSRLKTFRIGGGVEIHPFTMGKVIPSIGAEIYHKSQIFDGFEESQSFRNIQIPISVKYYISQISALEIAIVSNNTKYSSSSDTVIRFAYYYNLR